jgi:1,2-diacylglycerol 3-alpha-glucosyltransferase
MDFVHDFYDVPQERIEFYPLGGFVYEDAEYARIRDLTRAQYQIADDQILFVQSGKMDNAGKKVLESLQAFSRLRDRNARLILAGHLHESVAAKATAMISCDARIQFVGWRTGDELRALLCAADVYLQPGTQSATMQMSLCSRCALILDDVPSHKPYLDGNGWLIGKQLDLDEALALAVADMGQLRLMSSQSGDIALRLLDYRKLAARLYRTIEDEGPSWNCS